MFSKLSLTKVSHTNSSEEDKISENISAIHKNKIQQNELIEKIHFDFYNSQNSITDILSKEETPEKFSTYENQALKKLNEYNFKSSNQAIKLHNKKSNIESILDKNLKNKNYLRAFNYFQQKYPLYKFIFRNDVIKLCKKYNLDLGLSVNFKANIPKENLDHIINFKIDDGDILYRNTSYNSSYGKKTKHSKNILHIVAPTHYFSESHESIIDGEKHKVLDPIILQPVYHENFNDGYSTVSDPFAYLIITAWGKESIDSSVINPKMN